jgi:DNA-binding NarL/FixJ family response regulator
VAPVLSPLLITIVLAEDNLLVRRGLVELLADEPDLHVLAECTTYDEVLAAVDEHQPDILLTDIRMPPDHADEGIRAAHEVRARWPDIGVVVLSQYDDPEHALRLFDGGVKRRGYLLKDHVADPSHLATAIREVAAGGSSIDPAVVDVMLSARAARAGSPLDRLTAREREVLAEMASGRNNAAIAARLVITVRAVERHINSIFSKLDLVEETDYHRRVAAVLLFVGGS